MEEKKEASPLKDLLAAQGMSNRLFAEKAGVSFRAVADVRSGEVDLNMQSVENREGWSQKKRIGTIRTIARILIACGKNPQEWVKELQLSLTSEEERELAGVISQRLKSPVVPGLGSKEWNTLLSISDHVLTCQDIQRLAKAQEALGTFFTVKLAIEFLLSIEAPNQ